MSIARKLAAILHEAETLDESLFLDTEDADAYQLLLDNGHDSIADTLFEQGAGSCRRADLLQAIDEAQGVAEELGV